MVEENPLAWVETVGWRASVRLTFSTGPVPTEWHGDAGEWALKHSLKPSVIEALDCIKSANVLLVDMNVRRQERRRRSIYEWWTGLW